MWGAMLEAYRKLKQEAQLSLRWGILSRPLSCKLPRAGGTTAYRGASSGWPMEEALCGVTLKGCAE